MIAEIVMIVDFAMVVDFATIVEIGAGHTKVARTLAAGPKVEPQRQH